MPPRLTEAGQETSASAAAPGQDVDGDPARDWWPPSRVRYHGFLIEWIFYWIESSQIKIFESIFELNFPGKQIIEYFFELNIPEKNYIE